MAEEVKNTPEQEEIKDQSSGEGAEKETEGKEKKKGKKENKEHQIEELGLKLVELNDKYLRLSAEFDNYRKRTLKEKMDLTKNAGEQLLFKLLPVVDNFERALASMEKTTDVNALSEGVRLIYQSFKDFLSQNGVKEINCLNQEFNTDEQEAVTKIPAPSEEMKGKVVDCIEKGYSLNDKVIRFAKVVVGE